MIKIKQSVTINRPVEEIFEYMVNPENEQRYRSGLLELEITSEGPYGVGTTSPGGERRQPLTCIQDWKAAMSFSTWRIADSTFSVYP